MVTVDCPWCDAPVGLDGADALRCEGCSVEVELDAVAAADVPLAA